MSVKKAKAAYLTNFGEAFLYPVKFDAKVYTTSDETASRHRILDSQRST